MTLNEKQESLRRRLMEYGSVLVGYSGGVDSVFLAKFALDTLGPERVLAVTWRSASVPRWAEDTAREVAERFAIPWEELDTSELADPRYAANPSNRCYFCKDELWSRLVPFARARGYRTVVDGANADDASDHRPGAVAAHEHGVRSPLLELGITKADIRALSRELGLPTWDQPAAPCLASRLPYGFAVTAERLRQVEAGELALHALGFREARLRHHGDVARIEVPVEALDRALAAAPDIDRSVRAAGFARVVLDLGGYRRGALNEGLAAASLVQLGRGP